MAPNRLIMTLLLAASGLVVVTGGQSLPEGDWPQFRGPDRIGLSKEIGLMKEWPAPGPPQLWSVSDLGAGYGAISVKGDRIFVQGLKDGRSVVSSLERSKGTLVWSKSLGPGLDDEQGAGPRGTPTVDGDRVYVLTENGNLASLRAQDGSVLWQRDILTEFGAKNIQWKIGESPLVDGNNLIVTPGGRSAGMVALDKMSGKTIWTSSDLNDQAGYASVIVADVRGVRTYMTFTSSAGVGVRASDGVLTVI